MAQNPEPFDRKVYADLVARYGDQLDQIARQQATIAKMKDDLNKSQCHLANLLSAAAQTSTELQRYLIDDKIVPGKPAS